MVIAFVSIQLSAVSVSRISLWARYLRCSLVLGVSPTRALHQDSVAQASTHRTY
ncbi:MAG: hypothetical protein F6K44_23110 [Moorea sp. SIO3E2]|nr:hypothetical protein [Moorena sp. SIO3E2]